MVSAWLASVQGQLSPLFEARGAPGLALVMGAFFLGGCGEAPRAENGADIPVPKVAPESSSTHSGGFSDNTRAVPGTQHFEHDAGLTLAGTLLAHSFTVVNIWSEQLSVRSKKDDIIVNCGCTKFSLGKYDLAPGERTTVSISLDTARRSGAVKKGGEIIWTASDGVRYSTKFAITCDVKNAFELAPVALSFGAEDVQHGTVKEIRLTSNFPVDWNSITASSGSETFRVVNCEGFEGGATCRVECVARGDVEDAQSALRFAALGRSGGGALSLRKCLCDFIKS